MWIVLILCYICKVLTERSWRPADHRIWIRRALPSVPLPGRFWARHWTTIGEVIRLGTGHSRRHGAPGPQAQCGYVKLMSVPDSLCIGVVTPDDHVNIGFHEILLHDMEEEELPFVATSELDHFRRVWPKTLFIFMSRYQQDLERLRKECKERFG